MNSWDSTQSKGTLVVIGQGYVGLPVAMRAVEVGYTVVGLDTDTVRVWALQDGRSFVDDVPDSQLRAALNTGRYHASTNYADAANFDAAIITVPTPLKDSYPDLTFIEDAARALGPHVRRGSTVILESTSYPGTTEEILIPLLEQGCGLRAGVDFAVGYSPERIDPGNPRFNFVNTPKVVSGIDPESLAAVQHLYADLVETTVPVSSPKEAELTKLLENTFRHVNIALVNELAVLAHQLDVDIWEVISAASTKPFGYMRFTPGPGVGGHCLPVDPTYLSWVVQRDLHRTFKFVDLANDINDHMPDYVVARLTTMLNNDCKPMRNSTVLLLGLAYKPNTGDIRESPALRVIDLLADSGAIIEAVDTHIEPHRAPVGVKLVDLNVETLRRADVVVLITDHADVDYDLVTTHAARIFDTRHRLLIGNVEYL
jgi:UDP-N-acetyl-D-mannosaminuronic acid dehydrogenase/UDP-N-acetyl-D-glucosamine dehydrogenase